MEEMIKKIAELQKFEPNEKLSKVLKEYINEEISEDELSYVSAATGVEYSDFLKKFGNK